MEPINQHSLIGEFLEPFTDSLTPESAKQFANLKVKPSVQARVDELAAKANEGELSDIEHIIALKHGGLDDAGNLALACQQCNLHKGSNLSGIDPQAGEIVQLFHPRKDKWSEWRYLGEVTCMSGPDRQ